MKTARLTNKVIKEISIDHKQGAITIVTDPEQQPKHFNVRMAHVVKCLRITPDDYPRFAGEIKDSEGIDVIPDSDKYLKIWIFHSDGNIVEHKAKREEFDYTSDGTTISIPDVAPANLENMAAKAIRALHKEGLISNREVVSAHYQLNLPRNLFLSSGNIESGRE